MADTLDADWPTSEETDINMVAYEPSIFCKMECCGRGFKQDERFSGLWCKLAPKSKADYAFLLHGFYHLKNAKSEQWQSFSPWSFI